MAEQQPSQPTPQQQAQFNLTLLPAEHLSPAAIDSFYQSQSPTLWKPSHEAWHAMEAGAASDTDVDYLAAERNFRRTINQGFMSDHEIKARTTQQQPIALFPGSEAFLHTILGLAYLPHFAARHNQGRPATAEENRYTLSIVGRSLHYTRNPRSYSATSNAISQLVFHGLFLEEGAPLHIAPASPREVAGPSKTATHHVYGWDQDTQTKEPVRITYTGRQRSSRDAGVTLLRVGHKLHETVEDTELPHKYEPDERMRILRHTAALIVDRTRGYRLAADETRLLDKARENLYATILRRASEHAPRRSKGTQ